MRRWGQPWQPWTTRQARAYNQRLGTNLRQHRNRRHLTLGAVEQLTHGAINGNTLGAWERGTRPIGTETLATLAGVYGIDPARILPGETWVMGRNT